MAMFGLPSRPYLKNINWLTINNLNLLNQKMIAPHDDLEFWGLSSWLEIVWESKDKSIERNFWKY